jgi:hypothetical protein
VNVAVGVLVLVGVLLGVKVAVGVLLGVKVGVNEAGSIGIRQTPLSVPAKMLSLTKARDQTRVLAGMPALNEVQVRPRSSER